MRPAESAGVQKNTKMYLPGVKRADVMGYHAQRLRATPSPWDIKQGSAVTDRAEGQLRRHRQLDALALAQPDEPELPT